MRTLYEFENTRYRTMRKINKDPFSNGTEHAMFEHQCCDRCVKASRTKDDGVSFTNCDENNMPNRCSIQRDIMVRMISDMPINERTIQVCDDFIMKGALCPYMRTERKRYTKKNKSQLELL